MFSCQNTSLLDKWTNRVGAFNTIFQIYNINNLLHRSFITILNCKVISDVKYPRLCYPSNEFGSILIRIWRILHGLSAFVPKHRLQRKDTVFSFCECHSKLITKIRIAIQKLHNIQVHQTGSAVNLKHIPDSIADPLWLEDHDLAGSHDGFLASLRFELLPGWLRTRKHRRLGSQYRVTTIAIHSPSRYRPRTANGTRHLTANWIKLLSKFREPRSPLYWNQFCCIFEIYHDKPDFPLLHHCLS